jgi:hypothetical protein
MALQEKQLQTIKLFLEECEYTKGVETNAGNLVIGLGIRLDKKIFNQSEVNAVPEDVKENQNIEVNKVAEMFLVVEAKSCKDKKYFPQSTRTP